MKKIHSLALVLFLIVSAFTFSSCSSSSKAGSISPNKLNENSFVNLPNLGNTVTQNVYNPTARLDSEIAPGYLIALNSNQNSNLNGEFRISEQGVLELPYNVRVNASNTSITELRSLIGFSINFLSSF